MRSSRAVRLLQNPSHGIHQARAYLWITRKGYCATCDAKAAAQPDLKHKATATTAPLPIPVADHRHLGVDQRLFTSSVYSPGSPLFLPNGTKIFNTLTSFLQTQYAAFGFQEVITPTIYKKSLWEKSGHWDNYAEDMFSVSGRGASGGRFSSSEASEATKELEIGEDEEYGLKPMNCPGHCLIFGSEPRSYKDLPLRYADFSPLHRNEISGALSGLTRVRRFHQDDGHIFCRPAQIQGEILSTLRFIKLTYNALQLGPYRLALSTRPKDNFIGTVEEWDNAEDQLRSSLEESGMPWEIEEGEGAFYGPKIDIILKDTDGKEHQTATIQLDFQLPKRFDLKYQCPAPELEQKGETTTDADLLSVSGDVRPVMIHRAVLGSVERIMALLIEHHKGKWPFWLNPRQLMIITTNDTSAVVRWAKAAKKDIQFGRDSTNQHGVLPVGFQTFNVDLDDSARSVGKKVREAKSKGYSMIAVVGPDETEKERLRVEFCTVDRGPDETLVVTQKKILDKNIEKMVGGHNKVQMNPKTIRFIMKEFCFHMV
jgi:threonyl-tRNA synthetase